MNKITTLFNIKYPIIQGGMIWNSGYKLASAVSNAGGLGLIGHEKEVPLAVVIVPAGVETTAAVPIAIKSGFILPSAEGPIELNPDFTLAEVTEPTVRLYTASPGVPT